jgi:hypothetical protein
MLRDSVVGSEALFCEGKRLATKEIPDGHGIWPRTVNEVVVTSARLEASGSTQATPPDMIGLRLTKSGSDGGPDVLWQPNAQLTNQAAPSPER